MTVRHVCSVCFVFAIVSMSNHWTLYVCDAAYSVWPCNRDVWRPDVLNLLAAETHKVSHHLSQLRIYGP